MEDGYYCSGFLTASASVENKGWEEKVLIIILREHKAVKILSKIISTDQMRIRRVIKMAVVLWNRI